MYTPVQTEVFEYDYLFKVILIGDSGVGKSALMLRYIDRTFCDSYVSTIGVDFKVKTLVVDGVNVKVQIWDTASQDYFRSITSLYYKNCQGCLLIYDVTDYDSFQRIGYWLEEVKKYAPPDIVTYIVANKCDLEHVLPYPSSRRAVVTHRAVSTEEGKKRAFEFGLTYTETSAKYISDHVRQLAIDDIFYKLVKQLIDSIRGRSRSITDILPSFTMWSRIRKWVACRCCCSKSKGVLDDSI